METLALPVLAHLERSSACCFTPDQSLHLVPEKSHHRITSKVMSSVQHRERTGLFGQKPPIYSRKVSPSCIFVTQISPVKAHHNVESEAERTHKLHQPRSLPKSLTTKIRNV
jgi:hypothetical protein